jgi:chromosome segregation protein
LEGESLQPGGSMTGGAFKNSSNLLGRNREIEALEKVIRQYKEEAQDIRNRMEDVRTANALLKDDLEELQVRLQESYIQQNTLKVGVSHMQEEKQQQEAVYQGIRDEMHLITIQEMEIGVGKEQISIKLQESQRREEEIEEANQALSLTLEEQNLQVAQILEKQNEVVLRESQLEQQRSFLQQNIQRVAEEIRHLAEEQKNLNGDSVNSEQEIAERKQEILDLTQEISQADTSCTDWNRELTTCAKKREEMSAEHRGFFQKREELSAEINNLDKELFRLNSQKEKLDASEESLTEYMWQEYELTPHAAKEWQSEEYNDRQTLKKMVAQVRDEIRKLGNINVNAIEEYKEVSERYEFLRTQHDDLIEAEKTLLDIIKELDEGMRRQFQEKFADIQREFNSAFKELFGGGKGSLELTEGEDILECGVRIIAQPPGKKLQNMMQLSGGEKALTAIALLFAIQNLKPSPFCLLDEIEAALDDSNVDRFAKYLHKLTKNTQFIIITHRRGTMTAADRLYGITMQEKGISTLVSVNLIEKELDE